MSYGYNEDGEDIGDVTDKLNKRIEKWLKVGKLILIAFAAFLIFCIVYFIINII
jgi:hypothetical protein